MLRRLRALGVIVIVSVAIASGLAALGPLAGVTQFEDYTLDLRQRTTGESLQVGMGSRRSEVVLVLFDEFSVMDSIEGWDWISPYPRQPLAELVGSLADAGARTIGLDVYLDRLYPRLGGDEALRTAIERAGNVILPSLVQETDSVPLVLPPHPYFADVAADIGTAELPASFETFRHGAFAARSGGGLEPSFSLALYAHSRALSADSILRAAVERGRLELPGLPADVGRIDPDWLARPEADTRTILPFRIRYVGPPSSANAEAQAGTFPAMTSFSVPLLAPSSPEMFEDRIVLVGTGFHPQDRFRTPFFGHTPPADSTLADPEPYSWMYGVEVHANALQNMIDGEYVRTLDAARRIALFLLVAAFVGSAAFWGAMRGAGALVLAVVGVSLLAGWAWTGTVGIGPVRLIELSDRFLWVPVTVPILCGSFAYVGSMAYVSIVEGREKRFFKSAFGMYLSPDVVDRIAKNPSALELGGEKRPLTLLFSDLAGFTPMAERRDAENLVSLLNEYLDDMTQVVIEQRGYVDKYIGDAVMAFWNAPEELDDHADRALLTAIGMQRQMQELNRRWRDRDDRHDPLRVRIGIHTGTAIVGNFGGQSRFNYSAIGDDVNLAARLEPANKEYGTLTMVSHATLLAAGGRYRVRELDDIVVVGRVEPVKVFELIEEGSVVLSQEKVDALELFEEGIGRYRRHDWAGALARFEEATRRCPDDGPSRVYAERCRANIVSPPPPDWDFVVRRTEK